MGLGSDLPDMEIGDPGIAWLFDAFANLFDEMRIGSTTYRLRASVTSAMDGKSAEDAKRIGVGAPGPLSAAEG